MAARSDYVTAVQAEITRVKPDLTATGDDSDLK
jgi:hypothetical protein